MYLSQLRIFWNVQTTINVKLNPKTTINISKVWIGQGSKNRRSRNTDGTEAGCENVICKVGWGAKGCQFGLNCTSLMSAVVELLVDLEKEKLLLIILCMWDISHPVFRRYYCVCSCTWSFQTGYMRLVNQTGFNSMSTVAWWASTLSACWTIKRKRKNLKALFSF